MFSGHRRPGRSSSPQGKRAPASPPRAAYSHSASVGSRVPAQRQYACASSQDTWTTGWFARSPTDEPGPSGARQDAPRTPSHHPAPSTLVITSDRSPVKARWNTAEDPQRSASVTWPVSLTKVANAALVTAVASRRNGESVTGSTGSSPSSG